MTERQAQIIGLIHREVKPALGCTEPIAVALAVAKAVEMLDSTDRMLDDIKLEISLSGNILKNGMGVGIPGTGMIGLHIASALGAVCGESSFGLEVLHNTTPEAIERAKEIVDNGLVSISVADTPHKLYVKAVASSGEHTAETVIEDSHDHFVKLQHDSNIIFDIEGKPEEEGESGDYGITVREILEFAEAAEYKDIEFILDDRKLNRALAEEGLTGNYGLCVGKTLLADKEGALGSSFLTFAMALTAAASDARMAGCTLPAMSNSGSGNQGITVSMPVIAFAEKYGVSDEKLARALIISNLVAIHIKNFVGKLSALCGCVVASTGSACGMIWLRGGNYEQICATIKNMIGNITGMVCDGAKVGCAMKVASGVSSAIQSALLAFEGQCVSKHDGIIDEDIEKTIENLGKVGSVGMQETDNVILNIMVCK